MIQITICPSCGSDKIKKMQHDWTGKFQGRSYTVPSLEFYECPDCGERIYDRQAIRRIETYRICDLKTPHFNGGDEKSLGEAHFVLDFYKRRY